MKITTNCNNKKCQAYNENYCLNCSLNSIVELVSCQEYKSAIQLENSTSNPRAN